MKDIKKFDEMFDEDFYHCCPTISCCLAECDTSWKPKELKAYILSLITSMGEDMEKINFCSCTRVCYGHDVQRDEIKSIADKYLKLI